VHVSTRETEGQQWRDRGKEKERRYENKEFSDVKTRRRQGNEEGKKRDREGEEYKEKDF